MASNQGRYQEAVEGLLPEPQLRIYQAFQSRYYCSLDWTDVSESGRFEDKSAVSDLHHVPGYGAAGFDSCAG